MYVYACICMHVSVYVCIRDGQYWYFWLAITVRENIMISRITDLTISVLKTVYKTIDKCAWTLQNLSW